MSKLAIDGGNPVRGASKKWPSWPVSDEADAKLIAQITRSNRWSFDGPHEWDFAQKFTAYQKAKFGLACANGTVGIQLALEALGVGAYDEVIVPGLTWQATAAACLDVNAVPVLTDVEPDTWNLDLAAVEANITPKTRAVIVVHLYGSVTDLTKLQQLCKKHNLFLVEDCAHQHGTFWKGKGVGSFGQISSWSFQESKVLSSGEGGVNMCQTRELFDRLYSLRNCGRPYPADPVVFNQKKASDFGTTLQSGNYRITEWQAAILLGGLRRLDDQVKHRDANAQYLNAQLAQIPGISVMRRRKEVTQQSYFNFAFKIDPKELGVTNKQFAAALSAELRARNGFYAPYEPLNKCSLYKPQTKARHNLGKDYWKAIDPKRFQLPVCEQAHNHTGVVTHHAALMGPQTDMDDIAKAVKKLVDNLDDLRKLNAGPNKPYPALVK